MKSLICPNCGCIAHIPKRLEDHIKEHNNCEMCGSGAYVYDGEVEPLSFPKGKDRSKGASGGADGDTDTSH